MHYETRNKVCKFRENRAGLRPCGGLYSEIWSNFSKIFSFGSYTLIVAPMGVKFGVKQWTLAPLLHAKFHPIAVTCRPCVAKSLQMAMMLTGISEKYGFTPRCVYPRQPKIQLTVTCTSSQIRVQTHSQLLNDPTDRWSHVPDDYITAFIVEALTRQRTSEHIHNNCFPALFPARPG